MHYYSDLYYFWPTGRERSLSGNRDDVYCNRVLILRVNTELHVPWKMATMEKKTCENKLYFWQFCSIMESHIFYQVWKLI